MGEDERAAACQTCTKCSVAKPMTQFNQNRFVRAGYNHICKSCSLQASRARRAAYKSMQTRGNEPAGLQYCAQCCSTLPAVSFHFPCDTRSGLSHYCKACCSMSTLQMLQRRSGSQLQAESKVCSRCLASLPASSFYVSRSAASGLHSQCKGCFLQSYKERRQQKAP